MQTLLQCGHIVSTRDYPEWGDCPFCHCLVKVAAYECREWHVKCYQCRYGRWFGQDETSARRMHSKHSQVSVDYMVHPAKKKAVRTLYGRRVRLVIPRTITARARVERKHYVLILDTKPEDDIPPY